MTNQELKEFLKEKQLNALNIWHNYKPTGEETIQEWTICNYAIVRCWLCDKCITCCKKKIKRLEQELELENYKQAATNMRRNRVYRRNKLVIIMLYTISEYSHLVEKDTKAKHSFGKNGKSKSNGNNVSYVTIHCRRSE